MSAAEIKIVQIIKAAPGHYVLGTLDDDNGYPVEVCKYPILALGFEKNSTVPYPITWEGAQTENVYILQPDGTVEQPFISGFTNVYDWLKSEQDGYAEKKRGTK